MASSSEYFATLFSTLLEVGQPEIKLENVDGDILRQLIEFCYTGFISLDENNVQALVEASNEYRFTDIVSECSEYLAEQLDVENCVGLSCFADHHILKELCDKANKFICKNFVKVSKEEEFKGITVQKLKDILDMDNLCIESEQDIFHAVMMWIDQDDKKLKDHLADLLTYVRLTQLDEEVNMHILLPLMSAASKY